MTGSTVPNQPLGASGRLASFFQASRLTPLLALVGLLLGLFAVMVTPREEEPQIDVTMANVIVPFPGASVEDVASMVVSPAQQVLSQMSEVEHVMSAAHQGLAVITVQFKVGVPRQTALVRLYDTVGANLDWLPQGLGVMQPLIKPKGVDDVPVVSLTLHGHSADTGPIDLERVAQAIESDLKRVPGTREVRTLGGPGRSVLVEVDPARLDATGLTLTELRDALHAANMGLPVGELVSGNRRLLVETGAFLRHADDLADLVLSVRHGRPVYLREVASVREGAPPASRYVWHSELRRGTNAAELVERPAVTLTVTKQPGANAIDVANDLVERMKSLQNTVIPADIAVQISRNHGETANDKALTLIRKLLFATASVVALVFLALGRREAAIVGVAVVLTLTVTLFASWAWGFTLNRVSLFALIFSIGILVDDAIVVVENIHRHQQLSPGRPLVDIIPQAVDEVGGPTILATFTVIAALLPMAFVSGLMGPYMSPIPINASMGMLLSLAIAFVVTPWLARLWMKPAAATAHDAKPVRWAATFERVFARLLDPQFGQRNRRLLWAGVGALILVSLLLPAMGAVVLKMLPFDDKSEFQVVVDMPVGTPVEKTAAALRALGTHLVNLEEVKDYQAYAGTASPINFNGLVRQYDLRTGPHQGDLQVNLVDKGRRHDKSHAIAMRVRPELQKIGAAFGANVKVVEVPPGPPVLAPIVAEIYGPQAEGRRSVAKAVRQVFETTPGVVDVDDSNAASAPRLLLLVDRRKAAQLGVTQQAVATTLRLGLTGEAATYLRDGGRDAVPALVQVPAHQHGDLGPLLQLNVRSTQGALVPIRELVRLSTSEREQPVFHKNLLPVVYVTGDMAPQAGGTTDSPLYGMFQMRARLNALIAPDGGPVTEHFITAPMNPHAGYALKWDGEWQITYETFRDMGAAYAVGLVLIYLLVVAQFGSYLVPLIIMAPIPLTVVGVMPGHALFGAQFTATSMIGMIALAGIIVRNSILLVDFIHLQLAQGVNLERAIVQSAITRAQPIALTGLAAMIGALFILDDPIFNGLAISLIFGILVSTILTLIVIPTLIYVAYQGRHRVQPTSADPQTV